MKIYNAYYYEYIPGHGDSQRHHIASWCHSCGEHGLAIDVKIQPDNG